MDLIQQYLEKIKRIGDLYVLEVNLQETSTKQISDVAKAWNEINEDLNKKNHLIIVPDTMSLKIDNRYTFERAMQIVRSGGRVRRIIWNPDHAISLEGKTVERIWRINTKESQKENKIKMIEWYVPTKDDMEAIDWVMV